jgi:hypothetical protein
MPDTGAPWNIPYVEAADLVSDWPADSLALANAIADGLDAAGGLVAVKHALKTDTFTASVGSGSSVDVTGLSITHAVADAANRLIITAFFGVAANANDIARTGIGVYDGSALLGIGDAASNRTRVGSAGTAGQSQSYTATTPSVTFVHTPGSGSFTYTVRAINVDTGTATLFINRTEADEDNAGRQRGVSGLIIQEVSV